MELRIENIDSLVKASLILTRLSKRADLKCSREMFSLITSGYFPRTITALQIMPPFFSHFNCDYHHEFHQWHIAIRFFQHTLKTMNRASFSSLTLSLDQDHPYQDYMILHFHNSRALGEDDFRRARLTLLPPKQEEDVGEIDYSIFVSFDSQLFSRIVSELDDFTALVTLTYEQVTFSVEVGDITLFQQRNECVIGGLAEGEEARFFVAINPVRFFRDLSRQSKRIWLFKSANSYSIVVAPIELYAHFCVYFPLIS